MEEFDSFDPLAAKQIADTEVAAKALKKEIENILSSYVGWYDPFCELIQNALDSVEERASEEKNYTPEISIIVNIKKNTLTVSDNGTGLTIKKYKQFLAPCFSFKSGNTRGYKGVGATYLAYGFNYIQIATKTEDFSTNGKMVRARKWLTDPTPSGNPEITFDKNGCTDSNFESYKTGVSITLKFDETTHPKSLKWINAQTAEQWKKILLLKTGLGSFIKNKDINVKITVHSSEDEITLLNFQGIEFFWPYQITKKPVMLSSLKDIIDKEYKKKGPDFKPPSSIKNIECIYDTFDKDNLIKNISFSESEKEAIDKFIPEVHFSYMYTAKIWKTFNENLDIRKGHSILQPGIQLCANKMPQGEIIQVPLKRNIGRQNQILVVVHFHNCTPDMGRKGFQTEVVNLSKIISQKIVEELVSKYRKYLRISSGVLPDLKRESDVNNWKRTIEEHEKNEPINLTNKNFFLPMKKISMTSVPTREQDVIALFNQLIAGGVIRGIKIMSTNERFVYDGMFRISFEPPDKNHLFNQETNPLGVSEDYIIGHSGFISEPKILEYKYNLDGLIEDIEDGSKNSNDISLVIVWKTGDDYQGNYNITSLLDPDNLSERQFHGVTHVLTNLTSGQKEMDLIVLEELISYLNDQDNEIKNQINKYD